ncbi:MAG: TonB-dependent receptor, partial [Bacteroidota bacterium]
SRSYQDFAFRDRDENEVALLANDSQETAWRLRSDGDFKLSRSLTLGAGGGASREAIVSDFFQRSTPANRLPADLQFSTDLGLWKTFAYAQLTSQLLGGRLALTGGLRIDANDFTDNTVVVSPRATATYDLTSKVSVNAAVGRFTQSPELISLAVQENGAFVNQSLEWIDVAQVVAGVAVKPNRGLRLSAEGYFKGYSEYPVSVADPRISLANLGGDFGIVGAEPLQSVGEGRAYGVELSAQQRLTTRFYGIGAYTLGWSEFTGADGVFKPSSWDVRHSISATGGARLGRWEIGSRLTVRSGRPFTPFDLDASAIEYAISRRGVLDLDRLNQERTPAFVRWDVRVDRRIEFGRGINGVIYLDVQNVLGRENVFALEYTEDPAEPDRLREQTNVGRLPTIGFSVEF